MLSVVEIELQALITEREGMVAYNQYRCLRGETVAYPDEAFLELAEQIRALKPIEPPANSEQLAQPAICPHCQHGYKLFLSEGVATRAVCPHCGGTGEQQAGAQ